MPFPNKKTTRMISAALLIGRPQGLHEGARRTSRRFLPICRDAQASALVSSLSKGGCNRNAMNTTIAHSHTNIGDIHHNL